MKVLDYLDATIGEDATRILHRKIGKTRGMEAIESQIREEATNAARESYGGDLDRVARVHIDRYVEKRMGLLKHSFRQLKNPKTDTSKERGDRIGTMETKSAREYGRYKGFQRLSKSTGKQIYKEWDVGSDGCELCEANADEGPIPVDEDFSSGDSNAPAHLNCDCLVTYTDSEGNELD